MSEQNVEVVRKLFSALEDWDLAAVLRQFDSDVEWRPAEGGTYQGIDGVASGWAEWMEPWDEHHLELEEIIEAGEDRVIAAIHVTARGEQSGMQIDQRFFHLYTVREGKISGMVEYLDRADALEAAGLTE